MAFGYRLQHLPQFYAGMTMNYVIKKVCSGKAAKLLLSSLRLLVLSIMVKCDVPTISVVTYMIQSHEKHLRNANNFFVVSTLPTVFLSSTYVLN